MKSLNEEINYIKQLFEEVLSILKSVDNDNFDSHLNSAKLKIEEVNRIKERLNSTFPNELLKKYNAMLLDVTKQIQDTFDNLFTKKKNDYAEVGKQIAVLRNKYKLVNYYR